MKRLLESIMEARPLRVAALVSLCVAASAHAQGAHKKMTLSAYVDAAEGPTLLAGHYGSVIGALGSHGLRFKQDEVAAGTNLCVAYIMAREWSGAHSACDEAILFAKLEMPEWGPSGTSTHAEHVAIAYSNRAVLEWLENRAGSAAEDLSRAHALAPESELVAHNLARLHAPLTAARARLPLRGNVAPAAAAARG